MKKQIIYQNFSTAIAADSATEVDAGDLKFDNRSGKILAFMLTSKLLNQLWLRGSFRMFISGREIFPTGTPAKMFVINSSTPLEGRWYYFRDSEGKLDPLDAGDLSMQLKLLSTNNALEAFAAYDFTFTFKIETKQ